MGKLKQLTDNAYLVLTDNGDKLGLMIDYNSEYSTVEKTGVELHTTEGKYIFDSVLQIEEAFDSKFELLEEQEVQSSTETKFINGYPINDTDKVFEQVYDEELQFDTFKKSTRSKKRFIAGWFLVKSQDGTFIPRCTLSTDIYKERSGTDVHGPFKTFMELNHHLGSM